MREYREWLSADSIEAKLSIGGSFESTDITDYYLDPCEVGHDHIVDFDHDSVDAVALREKADDSHRRKVTSVRNDEDVVVYVSLF